MSTPVVASSLAALEPALGLLGVQRVLLFHGRTSFASSGAEAKLASLLTSSLWQVTRYEVKGPYPTAAELRDVLALMREADDGFDAVIAVGGGTVMDTAKAAALLVHDDGDLAPYVTREKTPSGQCLPMFLVPTTAGTGAEITPFAVVYIDDIKYSLAHPAMLPKLAVLDPHLTVSLPAKITAYTGCDALSQAIESFWSVRATETSRGYSREAIPLLLEALPRAVADPNDLDARDAMLRGAHLSGLAISISRTTAAHALSYPLTAFHGVPHGHAVMLTLPYFFPFLAEAAERPLQEGLSATQTLEDFQALLDLLGAADAEAARDGLLALMDQIQLPRRLSALGVKADDLPRIVEHGFNPQRVINFPVVVTAEMEFHILEEIL